MILEARRSSRQETHPEPQLPSTQATLTPLASLKVSRHHIPRHAPLPNTSLTDFPLLVYHAAFPAPTPSASAIEAHLRSTGVLAPQWRATMYRTTHFHSTTHELLVVSRGAARLLFGGEDSPGAVALEAKAGDAVLVPGGVGHRLLEDRGGEFEMVGAYPVGAEQWDMCYGSGDEDRQGIEDRIRALEWFGRDPLYGDEGPALDV
ncbi:hypothetical protein EIP86_009294 [Pleurotus ostreatoroseus]|nr:hypothetical protein EIP86_009294 [Pleurotus ostreatoroseus]